LTAPPPEFVADVVQVFRASEDTIGTEPLVKGLTSNEVLAEVAHDGGAPASGSEATLRVLTGVGDAGAGEVSRGVSRLSTRVSL